MADREIDIFSAEKYFNGAMDEESGKVGEMDGGKKQVMENEKRDLENIKLNFAPKFRSSCSEASWGSRNALLPEVPRDRTRSHKSKMNGKRFLSTFSWKCSCYNSKSVDTRETVGGNKNSGNDKKNAESRKACMEAPPLIKNDQRKEGFVLTVSNSAVADLTARKEWAREFEGNECNTPEGFGSPILLKGDKAVSLDKRLTTFSWDVHASAEDIPAIAARKIQDDEGSDSSSDLFEINNLSENPHPFFRHSGSDDMLTCVTTTCYEPSEASIDWSVVTASAVNVPTVSNYEEKKPETEITQTKATTKRTCAIEKQVERSHSILLSGCTSQRAFKVSGNACRVPEKTNSNTQRRPVSRTLTTMAESQTKSVIRNFESASLQQASRTCSVSQWQAAQASHSLDMH